MNPGSFLVVILSVMLWTDVQFVDEFGDAQRGTSGELTP